MDDDLIILTDEVYRYICEFPNQTPEFYCKKLNLNKKEFAKIIRWLGKRSLIKYNPINNTIDIGFAGKW